ncbi:unnamed protein product [Withania somnifera]
MTMNGLNSYFKRNWNRDDMMNLDEIPLEVHATLKKVYLMLFCVMLSATFGCFLNWFSLAGGRFTVLSFIASFICLYFTLPGRVKTVILLWMLVSFSFGASVGHFASDLFRIKQIYVLKLLAGSTMGIGNFLYRAILSRERIVIYLGCLEYCYLLMLITFGFLLFDTHKAFWVITTQIIHTLFMGYIVLYSQELLYDANFGDINFVNCTFTVFFNLPAIVIHAARVYLQGAEFEEHEQN